MELVYFISGILWLWLMTWFIFLKRINQRRENKTIFLHLETSATRSTGHSHAAQTFHTRLVSIFENELFFSSFRFNRILFMRKIYISHSLLIWSKRSCLGSLLAMVFSMASIGGITVMAERPSTIILAIFNLVNFRLSVSYSIIRASRDYRTPW